MSASNKNRREDRKESSTTHGNAPETGALPPLNVGQWQEDIRPVRRVFPGPKSATAVLRVAIEQSAYSELVSHAKEELESEVCGVLVGETCRDDRGDFVYVQAIIRGETERRGRAHVTFTQETWNKIHDDLERLHPWLRIVGWYHSHPGFGVAFSEMDTFIHRNFFPSRTHVALITDPLGGEEALCINSDEGVTYLDAFWVAGRERSCRVPERRPSDASDVGSEGTAKALHDLETRVTQLMGAVDELRQTVIRVVAGTAILGFVLVIGFLGYFLMRVQFKRYQPPEVQGYLPVPLRIDDKDVLLGFEVKKWSIPPELRTEYRLREELLLRRAEEAAAAAAAEKGENGGETPAASPPADKSGDASSTEKAMDGGKPETRQLSHGE